MASWEPPPTSGEIDLRNTARILSKTHRWTLFLSIIGFVIAGFSFLAFVPVVTTTVFWSAGTKGFFGLPQLAFWVYGVLAALFLFKFSRSAKLFSESIDVRRLHESLNALHNYFRLTAILAIVGLVFAVAVFIYLSALFDTAGL